MTPKTMLPLVAVACFGLGLATGRVFFKNAGGGSPPNGLSPGVPSPTAAPGSRHPPDGRGGRTRAPEADPAQKAVARLDHDEEIDFRDTARLLDTLPAGERREHLLHRLAERWAQSDPEAALAWAATLRPREQEHATDVVFHTWCEEAPADALAYAAALPNSERSLSYVHHLAHQWARRDRAAAIAWATAQGDVAVHARALRGVTEAWAGEQPRDAAGFAMAEGNALDRRELLEIVSHRWAESDWREALAWAGGLGDSDRGVALRSVLHSVAEGSPEEAAALFEGISGLLTADARRDAAGEVAARWAESSPADAANWALGLPEGGHLQRRAVHELVQHWLRLDSLAASGWVGTLPAGETRDAAAGTLVEHVARSDPESAFAWAASIDDEGHRAHMMNHSLEHWHEIDPAAARAAFDAAPLDAEQRRHLGALFRPDLPTSASP